MSAVTKPEPRDRDLPPQALAIVDERRLRNRMVQQIRGATWSRDLDHNTVLAVAEYAHRTGADPVTEIEVLGGRIYRNANYYDRKGAELIQAGVIAHIERDHIAADPRLDDLITLAESLATDGDPQLLDGARDAKREKARRMALRIKHGAPEKAAAVCVVRLFVVGMAQPIEGCNWCGNGVRQRDPVGDAEPVKTAETRAARRAWKQLVLSDVARRVPAVAALADAERVADDDGASVSEMIVEQRAQVRASHRAALPQPVTTTGTDGYGDAAAASDTPAGDGPHSAAPAPVMPARTSAAGQGHRVRPSHTASGAQSEVRTTVVSAEDQARGLDVARAYAEGRDPYVGEPGEMTDAELLALDEKRMEAEELALEVDDTRKPRRDALREG